MNRKRWICIFLAFVLIFTAVPSNAAEASTSAAEESNDAVEVLSGAEEASVGVYPTISNGGTVRGEFTKAQTEFNYTFTASATRYYKFTLVNQQAGEKLGIVQGDSGMNQYMGKIALEITDESGAVLSTYSVRCGYSGDVYLKINKGDVRYLKLSSQLEGAYTLSVASYSDIGGNTINAATQTRDNLQVNASLDSPDDKDWYFFTTDEYNNYASFLLKNITGVQTIYFNIVDLTTNEEILNQGVARGTTREMFLKLKPNTAYAMQLYILSGNNTYQLNVTQTLDVGGDTIADAFYAVNKDITYTSAIDAKGDTDFFSFTTENYGAYYYFNVKNLDINGGAYLYVCEAEGTEIEGGGMLQSEDFCIDVKLKPNTTYYIRISADSNVKGRYSLRIEDTVDHHANEHKEATGVSLYQKYDALISGDMDVDFFKFNTLSYDAYYFFEADCQTLNGDIYITVYDAAGNRLGRGQSKSKILNYNIKLDPNKEYYFSIESEEAAKGDYSFTINTREDEQPNVQEQAAEILLNTTVDAHITGWNDVDYYKFTTENYDAFYFFTMKNHGIDKQYYMRVYDAAGNELGNALTSSENGADVIVKLSPNSVYYCAIGSTYEKGMGDYQLLIYSKEDDAADEQKKAQAIAGIGEFNGHITGWNDVDWFRFCTEEEGSIYFFQMDNVNILSDYFMYVYDAAGNQLCGGRSYERHGVSCSVRLESNTIYYIKIYAGYEGLGDYKLNISRLTDDAGDKKEQAGEVVFGELNSKTLSTNTDVDWFMFTLTEPSNVRLHMMNNTVSLSIELDGKKMELYSELGTKLKEFTTYNGNTKSKDVSIELDAGTYYIKVSGKKGDYAFAVGDCGAGHVEQVKYQKATPTSSGYKITYCASCCKQIRKETVYYLKTFKISKTTAIYNGKVQKPTVTVVDSGNNTIPKSEYTVTYSGACKNAGTYTVKVTMTGQAYSGNAEFKYTIKAQDVSKCKISLSTTEYSYNGKIKKPSVTVKNANGVKLGSSSYSVTYASGRKNVGKYKVTIKMKGNYTGTKTLYFTINPAKTSISKVTAGKKSLAVTWSKKSSQVTGYQIQYSTGKNFKSYKTKTVTSNKSAKATLSGLISKKTYYVRVRTYKTVNGMKYYSDWSTVKSKKTK